MLYILNLSLLQKHILISTRSRTVKMVCYNNIKYKLLRKKHSEEGIILKKIITKLCFGIASFAFMITSLSANTTCMFFMYQPKLPIGAEKLKRC